MTMVMDIRNIKLEDCTTNAEIDNYFENRNISCLVERTHMLGRHMGIKSTVYCGNVDDEGKYESTKETFLNGDWKFFR